jgi:hypothetical protein
MCKTENNNNKPLDSNSIKTLNTIKMKKMKKSLLTLLTAILIGSSFTSCVENTIPDEVVAIYDGQANLLAAQAALLAAEANEANAAAALSAAMSAAQQAQTEAQTIANAYAQANNAILLAAAQAALASQIAQDAANLADQEAALIARTAEHAAAAALAQAQLDVMVANNAAAAALAAEQLAALIAQNDVNNSAAIAALEASIAQNAIDAANAEAALAATIAQNAIDAANAQEALANTIAQNALALEAAQADLANMAALNAIEIARQQAELEAVLAQAVINAELATLALAEAQAQHAIDIENLANQLAQLDDDLLNTYFGFYQAYSGLLNVSQNDEIGAQLDIINKIGEIALLAQTDAQAIAGFNNDLSIAQSAKADLEAEKAILEASIAAGTSIGDNTAKAAELQAEIDAIDAELVDLLIEIAEVNELGQAQSDAVQDMIAELGLADLENDFQGLKDDLADAIADKAIQVAANEGDAEDIVAWTETVTNYAATTATLEGNITTAEAAADAAADAADTAADAAADAADADDDAADLVVTETAALGTLTAAAATAQVDVNAAAQAWEDAKDDLATSTTQADVDAAIIVLDDAQEAYDIARANFDDQTLDYTWSPGPDGQLGIQADGPQAAVETYKVVTSITASGTPGALVYTATFGEATTDDVTGGTAEEIDDEEDIDATTEIGDYYEFGLDDTSTNDLEEFQDSTEALDIAKDDLEAANDANIDLVPVVAAAKALYENKVDLYENAAAFVATQEGVVAAATAAADAAADAADAADDAADTAADDADDADTAVTTAEAALTLHEGTTVAEYESDIEDAEVAILQRDITIADMDIAIAAIEAEIVIVLAKLDAGKPADLIAAEATLEALEIQFNILLTTQIMLDNSRASKVNIILVIGTPSIEIQNVIDGMDADIAEQDALIATAEANIIAFPGLTEEQRDAIDAQELANLITVLAGIQIDIELYTALSTKYKDLVDSLL